VYYLFVTNILLFLEYSAIQYSVDDSEGSLPIFGELIHVAM